MHSHSIGQKYCQLRWKPIIQQQRRGPQLSKARARGFVRDRFSPSRQRNKPGRFSEPLDGTLARESVQEALLIGPELEQEGPRPKLRTEVGN